MKTQGMPPEGRYHHSMHYYRQGGLLVVLGGRRFARTNFYFGGYTQSEFLSQVCVLRVDTLEWFEVKFKQNRDYLDSFPELFDYADCLVDDTILIFGGMSGAEPRPYSLQKDLYSLKLNKLRKVQTEHHKTKSSQSLFSRRS